MLRAALTALVLATATVACGGGASGPAVVAGAPAGDVTEVSGSVTATRDGKPRPLVVGDAVSGDDVVETGADGRVAIRLRHNLVPWTLGPGKKEQVAASLAWKAPRASQVAAGPTGERSGAAGRHAEREAAEGAASVSGGAPAAMAPPARAAADPEAMAPGAAPAATTEAARADQAPPPPPDMERAATKGGPKGDPIEELGKLDGDAVADVHGDDAFGAGGLGLSGTGAGGGGTGEGGIGLGNIGTLGHGSGTGEGRGLGAGGGGSLGARAQPPTQRKTVRTFATTGGLDQAVVARVVRHRNARLIACVEPAAPTRAVVKFTISKDGKVESVTVSGATTAATSCLTKWMQATTFPKTTSATTASVAVDVSKPDE